jgi:molybdenum cofactor cytidylyltransferase
MTEETGIIVLAAGASTRMGTPKQLLRQVGGLSLVQQAVQTAQDAALGPIVVVLGANAVQVDSELEGFEAAIAFNPDWETGMGSSIAIGVQTLLELYPHLEQLIVMLGDQPLLTPTHLGNLAKAAEQNRCVMSVSTYAEICGVPAFFGKPLFEQLRQLRGAQGAKQVIQQNLPQAVCVPFAEGALDIDTPEDWQQFQQRN